MISFASGFARRTRFIIIAAGLYILSGLGIVVGMIIAPNETAEDLDQRWRGDLLVGVADLRGSLISREPGQA